jgi:hypothetical protein
LPIFDEKGLGDNLGDFFHQLWSPGPGGIDSCEKAVRRIALSKVGNASKTKSFPNEDGLIWPPLDLGSSPTIAIYNARAVKIYNATNSIVRFQNKNYLRQM